MAPRFVLVGLLRREFLLPPVGNPLIDTPGGNLLYAAGGLRVWESKIGLLGRVGEDYPFQWRRNIESRGFDMQGLKILPGSLDLRSFCAYSDSFEGSFNNPVSHFAQRQLNFPKALLGYQPPDSKEHPRQPLPEAPTVSDIPEDYLEASAVHICPMDFTSQGQLINKFKAGLATTITLDPQDAYMNPDFLKDLRELLNGLTAFLPSQEELQALFWGKTNDLWEMAEELGSYGCELVVIKRGGQGQWLYDVMGSHRWEIPAYTSRKADPTGAGDAFCGGFLAGYRNTYDPLEAALHGNVSASLNLEGSGAFYPLDVAPGLAQARLDVLREMAREV
ncbi:MAG: carbohydrate kinase family protein [Anaerolineales bacterium]|jgi:sugar/nucleoside kinase (ribokinase family)